MVQSNVIGWGNLASTAGLSRVGAAGTGGGAGGGTTERPAVCGNPVLSPKPEMITEVVADTAVVFTVKVVLFEPPGTVTLAGTVATPGSRLDNVTTTPRAGATPLRVAVPVELLPPVTVAGLRESDASETFAVVGSTVRRALTVEGPYEPESVTLVLAATALVL